MNRIPLLLFLAALLLAPSVRAGEIVQLNTTDAFNMRPISTVVNGKLVPMNDNIDGAGGVATAAAAKAAGVDDPKTMPDDGKFPATDKHPEIVLTYATDDGKKNLARKVQGEDSFAFNVPKKNYAKLYLFFASGQGASKIGVDLRYTDKTIETHVLDVPDWFWELKPSDTGIFYVASDLSKWTATKKIEDNHHYIFGLDVHPNPEKTLDMIRIRKDKPGLLTFYGGTGETKD
jgi:hypothetical protein